MTTCISILLLMPATWTLPGQSPVATFTNPPDVKIVFFGFLPATWSSGEKAPVITNTTNSPTGNLPIRAEYGVEPEQRPVSDDDLGRQRMSELTRGGGSHYSDYELQTSSGVQLTLIVENTGARTIEAIDWEYARVNLEAGQKVDRQTIQSSAEWKRVHSRVKLTPGATAPLSVILQSGKRRQSSKPDVYVNGGVRIRRVDYAVGPDWLAQ